MPSPRRRYAPHPPKKFPVIANQRAHRCGNPHPPRTAPSLHGGNGFPRRCAPRNDSFMKMRRPWTGGAEPPPLRMFCKFLCRAAPMCAAARHASHLQQNPCHCEPVRTPVWQSVPLLHRTSNLCVGAGFYPARSAAPSQLSPVGRHPCVPPPTRTAPPTAGHTGPALQGKIKTVRRGRCPHRPADHYRTFCYAPVGGGVPDAPPA